MFISVYVLELNNIVSLKMIDVDNIRIQENSVFVYTGTQHHVEMVDSLDNFLEDDEMDRKD